MKNGKGNTDDSNILDIARGIAKGVEVDWNVVESSAPRSQQSVVHYLKVISSVAKAHEDERRSYDASGGASLSQAQQYDLDTWGPLEGPSAQL